MDSIRKSETNWVIARAALFASADYFHRPCGGLDRTLDLGPDVTLQDLPIDPSDGSDLVRSCSTRCKAARAKRVDDERVRKCASHVGELVQSHPSSASGVLTPGAVSKAGGLGAIR